MDTDSTKPIFTVSRSWPDEHWDQFLSSNPSGQFQQSSLWAQVKVVESWECARLLVQRDGRLVGGAQLLFRSTRFGKIGFINKGPVLAPGAEDLFPSLLEALRSLCLSLHLQAWVLQPPDESMWQTQPLHHNGYLPAYSLGIIDATLLLDLSNNLDIICKNINRTTRQKAHQAERAGVRIRIGDESDVSLFFDLMKKTCQRQRAEPNPKSVSTFFEMWRAFQPSGRIRLTFAEMAGLPAAGLLCLIFGRRVTLWKKGWNSSSVQFHPNELLHLETIKWAWESGYQYCDFAALDRGTAEAMLASIPLTQEQKHSRHLFNIKLGAAPKLLPRAVLFIANPFARDLYRTVVRIPRLASFLRMLAKGLSQK